MQRHTKVKQKTVRPHPVNSNRAVGVAHREDVRKCRKTDVREHKKNKTKINLKEKF